MKTKHAKLFLATAAIAAIGMGSASKSAHAFDSVVWDWNKTVTDNILKDITVDVNIAPTGMVQIEKTQEFIGDLAATSTVTNISNNPPSEIVDGVVQIEDFFNIQTLTDDSTNPNTIDPAPGVFGSELQLQAELLGGTLDEGTDELSMDFRVFGEFELEQVAGELDAVDLPMVESVATAVANNQDIFSDVALDLHDAQFAYGGFTAVENPELAAANLEALLGMTPDLDNAHTTGLATLTMAGALGMIEPANISATSTVNAITNASVNSAATALANNMSVELAHLSPGDAFMTADITQFGYADVTATSLVDDISVSNYAGLGAAGFGLGEDQVPLISSAATAVGNNLNITVSAPEL